MLKFILSSFLFVFIFFASGCTVAKGMGGGACGLGMGVAEGAKQDTNSVVNFINSSDQWIRDNLW